MFSSFSHQAVLSTVAAAFLAVALPQASIAAANAQTGVWKLNMAQSTFGTDKGTIVMERDTGAKASGATANGSNTFLVVSNGKVFLAESEDAYAANGIKTIDYSSWRGMRLVEIGDRVRIEDHCGFRCQSGLPENRIRLTFRTTTDMSKTPMHDLVVLNN
jgi:hypothetical protein